MPLATKKAVSLLKKLIAAKQPAGTKNRAAAKQHASIELGQRVFPKQRC